MDSLNNLIKTLEPNQKTFTPQYIYTTTQSLPLNSSNSPMLIDILKSPFSVILKEWKQIYKWTEEDFNKLYIYPVGRKYSLYASLLHLLNQKYNMTTVYNQNLEVIENFMRLMISRMELNKRIRLILKDLKLRVNSLIDEIKNSHYQSPNVIYYLSLFLDLNIIILSKSEIELYYCEENYDNCKPHVLLYRDSNQLYHPIIYGQTDGIQLLTYHEHELIRNIIDNPNKKTVNKKNYIKKAKIHQSNYKSYLVADLRKIAASKGINITKINETNGKKVYKTKIELISEIESQIMSF